MDKRILGKTGFSVSVISFGGIVVDRMDAGTASQIVSEAVDQGVNYFDVAPAYGDAQYILGPALEPYRKNVYLACKTLKRGAAESRAELQESLKALRTDYFDNYQLHALDDPEEIEQVFSPGGAMETLRWAQQEGIVRNIGFTCHKDVSAERILSHSREFATMLFPVNFAYREAQGGSKQAITLARENGMGILAMKGMAHRQWRDGEEHTYPKCWYRPIFDDPELARMALNYTLSQDVDTALPPGDERMFRLALSIMANQNGVPVKPSEEEMQLLKNKADGIQEHLF